MSVVIRLSKTGKTHRISYRIAVQDKLSKRDGKFIENLGFYDPNKPQKEAYRILEDRYAFWVSKGAKPSKAVLELVEGNGTRPARPKRPRKEAETEQLVSPQVSEPVSQKTNEPENDSKEKQKAPPAPADSAVSPKSTGSTESQTH